MQCFIIFLVNNQTETNEKQLFIYEVVSCDVSFKRLFFSALRRTPRRAKGVEMKAESISPLMLQTMSSQHIRDFVVWCSTKTNFWSSHCTLVALCSTQSASNAQREWRTAQHRNVFTHCSIQNQVLIVPSPNKKLCQLRALISTSAIGVLRIIEINLSPMCIFFLLCLYWSNPD